MKRFFAITLTGALFAVALPASTQAAAPAPPPELTKVAYLLGTWNCAYPAANGAKMTSVEENTWMDGGFFLFLHEKENGGNSSLGIMGYDADAKMYTYDEYDSRGRVDHPIGTIEGDTWTWKDKVKKADQPTDSRFVLTTLSPTSYTFKYETSAKGSEWKTEWGGTCTKTK